MLGEEALGEGALGAHGTKIEYVFHQTLFPRAIKGLAMRLGATGMFGVPPWIKP